MSTLDKAQSKRPYVQSRLLDLPAELQLSIYEFVVIENDKLLLNCGCDSSYPGRRDLWAVAKRAWANGEIKAPCPPPLTRTCRAIRDITLPMFYKCNKFRIHYCYAANLDTALEWFTRIGAGNRRQLGEVYLHDGNPRYDLCNPRDIKTAKRELMRVFGAWIETVEESTCCSYRVHFGASAEAQYDGLEQLFGT